MGGVWEGCESYSSCIRQVVADFGCGDAKIAATVSNAVFSFDLVKANEYVIVANSSKVLTIKNAFHHKPYVENLKSWIFIFLLPSSPAPPLTPLSHPSPTPLTPLSHPSHTPQTPLSHPSHTPLTHPHTPLSHTPPTHLSHPSHTSFTHPSHTSHTPLTHPRSL